MEANHSVPTNLRRLYSESEDFKIAFDEMYNAVEALSKSLLEVGRALPYPQLHNACVSGNLALVGALLNNGLSPDMYPCTEDEDDLTPLGWIAREEGMAPAEKVVIAELLLARGVDPAEGDPTEQAEICGDMQFADFLGRAIARYEP